MQTWQFLPCAFWVYASFFIGVVCGGHDRSVLVPYRPSCMRGSLFVVPYRTGGMRGSFWSELVPYRSPDFLPPSQIRRNFNWWFKCKLGNFCPACSKFAYRFYSRLYEGVMIDQCGYLLLRVYEGVTEVVPYRICGTRASFWFELVPYRNFDFWYNQNQFFYLYFYILGR